MKHSELAVLIYMSVFVHEVYLYYSMFIFNVFYVFVFWPMDGMMG